MTEFIMYDSLFSLHIHRVGERSIPELPLLRESLHYLIV